MPKLTGGCLCGAVRYEVEGDIAGASVCHCTHCQRISGSAFSVNVLVPRGAMKVTGGALGRYIDTADSGRKLERQFCSRCGSSIASEPDGMPTITVLKAGTLDDTSWLKPGTHIWTASRQPWVEVPAQVTQFAKGRT